MSDKVNVTVVGSGYVGMSLAVLLAQQNDVTVLDIDPERVDLVNRRESTVADPDIEAFLRDRDLSSSATLDVDEAYSGAEFVVVATLTNYDPDTNRFDTRAVDTVVMQATVLANDFELFALNGGRMVALFKTSFSVVNFARKTVGRSHGEKLFVKVRRLMCSCWGFDRESLCRLA